MTKTAKPSAFMREFPAFYFPKRALRRVRRRKPEIRGVLFTDDECRVKIATAVGRPNMTTNAQNGPTMQIWWRKTGP